MATAADALTIPAGWEKASVVTVADIGALDPHATVEIETSPDFYALSVFGLGDVVGNVPTAAQQLDQAAQQYGSRVYALILLHRTDVDLLGVSVDRYRWIVVHSQFPALIALVALPIIIAMIGVWLECHGQPIDQCGQMLQTTAHDAGQSLCNIFGASCALSALGGLLLAFSAASIGLAGVLFFLESGVAQRMGIKGPALPRVPAPVGVQPPRISTSIGAPGGPQVRVATGGRSRRGLGGLGRVA